MIRPTRLALLTAILVVGLLTINRASAQSFQTISTIFTPQGARSLTPMCTGTGALKTCAPVMAIGWLAPFDGGGGTFYWNGTMNCTDNSVTLTKKADGNYWDAGDRMITVTDASTISNRMYSSVLNVANVPVSAGLPVFDQVTEISSMNNTITFAIPFQRFNSTTNTINFNLENGGSRIAGTGGYCFNRTQQNFS